MSRQRIVMLSKWVVVLAAFSVVVEAHGEDVDARALVQNGTERYRSVGTEREVLEILIVASPDKDTFTQEDAETMVRQGGRGITHKRAARRAIYAPDRRDKIHVGFSLPAEDQGTGYLVWRELGETADKQWLYMPALRKVRRVPVSSSSTFVGTNLSYEDVRELAGENVDRYIYEHVGSETFDEEECDVVTARPGPKTTSTYASRKLWIDRKRAFTLQIEYFDKRGVAVKRLHNVAVHQIKPGVHRAGLTEMRDLSLNEATLIWFSEREVGGDIPAHVFTVDYLENP